MTLPALPPIPDTDPRAQLVAEVIAELREEGWNIPPGVAQTVLEHIHQQATSPDPATRGPMGLLDETFRRFAGKYADRGILDDYANLYAGIRYALIRYGPGTIPADVLIDVEPLRTLEAMGTRLPELPEPIDGEPDNPVLALVNAAAWLDAYDTLARSIAGQLPEGSEDRERLLTTADGDGVQVFLRGVARWLQDRPAVAARLWEDVQRMRGH
jgi:hypothetical protein